LTAKRQSPLTEQALARATTVKLSDFHAYAGPLKETAIHYEERKRLDIFQPTHNMTMSTYSDDAPEQDYDDHDDASLPYLHPSIYEIYVITHYCHDCPVKYQESDYQPAFQPRLTQPQLYHLDQLSFMTKKSHPHGICHIIHAVMQQSAL
jgi:hypothetical protein